MATEERREEGGTDDGADVLVQISSDNNTDVAANIQYFAIQVGVNVYHILLCLSVHVRRIR